MAEGRGQRLVVVLARRIPAIGEAAERHPKQRQFAAPHLARPHRLAAALRAHQHVEEAVAALEERELVDRAARDLERARRARRRAGCGTRRSLHVPDEHRANRRDVEHAARRARAPPCSRNRARACARSHTVTVCSAMPCVRIELLVGAVDARRRRDALEIRRVRPAASGASPGSCAYGFAAPGVEIERGVEHQLAADQAARVVARRVVVVGAQVVGRAVARARPTREMSNRPISVPPRA